MPTAGVEPARYRCGSRLTAVSRALGTQLLVYRHDRDGQQRERQHQGQDVERLGQHDPRQVTNTNPNTSNRTPKTGPNHRAATPHGVSAEWARFL